MHNYLKSLVFVRKVKSALLQGIAYFSKPFFAHFVAFPIVFLSVSFGSFNFVIVSCKLNLFTPALAQVAPAQTQTEKAQSEQLQIEKAQVEQSQTEPTQEAEIQTNSVEDRKVAAETPSKKKRTGRSAPPKIPKDPSANRKKVVGAGDSESSEPKVSNILILGIEVEGNKKIESDAILNKLKTQVGMAYDEIRLREDIQALFKTGYFYDVQVFRQNLTKGNITGYTLIYKVTEKPSVTEIKIEGNSDLKTEELTDATGIKLYEILNVGKVKEAAEKLQKLYEDKGYFLAKVESKIEDIQKDENVRIVFNIKENEKVKIKKITFLGNKNLVDGQLKSKFLLSEEGFFSFMSSSGSYKQDVFDHSVALLQRLYQDEGFVSAQIHRPQVYVTPNKKWIYITVRIDEGEKYNVGEVDFSGDMLFTRDELLAATEIHKREVFSRTVLEKDIRELEAKFGDLGYAFANVLPRTRINEKERKVDITFEFDKGSKVYFGRINVVGNSSTRDKVVRRELRVREGELYNETRRRRSEENIRRLGYFEEVNFKTSVLPERQEILNMDIVVKERTTGTLNVGAGYSTAQGTHLQGQMSQTNFLGKGQSIGARINLSSEGSIYEFNFTEPYFNDTNWSLGFDLVQDILRRTSYEQNIVGGAVRFGHPIGEYLTGTVKYGYHRNRMIAPVNVATRINPNTGADFGAGQYYDFPINDPTLFPLDRASGIVSSVTGILEFDKRNDRFSPSSGLYASTALEYAGVGGDLRYTRSVSKFRYFKKIFWEVVWRNNFEYAFITPHNSNEEPPFNELFLLGGGYSLRGYRPGRVGTTKFSDYTYNWQRGRKTNPLTDDQAKLAAQLPYGGRQKMMYQMEFEFPLVAEAGIKGVTFYDVGLANDIIINSEFYGDVGFGFRWFSPLGPLRFEWGFPMRQVTNSPDSSVFEFSIGAPF